MNQHSYKQFYHRNLPHIVPPDATFFVTYRLADSVPQAVIREYQAKLDWLKQEEAQRANSQVEREAYDQRLKSFAREWFAEFEDLLHRAETGPTWLKDERLAQIVADSLHFLDGKSYRLDAYCVMSNHVHVVFKPSLTERELHELVNLDTRRLEFVSEQPTLSKIMQSLKGFTARECNKVLERKGRFWQHESYDHYVRDDDEYGRIVRYVLNNPVKAGLVEQWQDWQWSYQRVSTVQQPFQVAGACPDKLLDSAEAVPEA